MDLERFIQDVQSHPELYDKRHRSYMDTRKKNSVWDELSQKYKYEAAVTQTEWHLLPLKFLDDCLRSRRMVENIEDADETSTSSVFHTSPEETENQSTTPEEVENLFPTENTRSQRRMRRSAGDPVDSALVRVLESFAARASQPQEEDDDELFFKSLLPKVREMDARKKVQFRIQVMQLVAQGVENT